MGKPVIILGSVLVIALSSAAFAQGRGSGTGMGGGAKMGAGAQMGNMGGGMGKMGNMGASAGADAGAANRVRSYPPKAARIPADPIRPTAILAVVVPKIAAATVIPPRPIQQRLRLRPRTNWAS